MKTVKNHMIGGCALNHGLEKVCAQKCGMSVRSGCAQFVTGCIYNKKSYDNQIESGTRPETKEWIENMEKRWRNKGINITTTNKTFSPQEHLARPIRYHQRIPLDHSFPTVYILWGFGPSSETQSSEYWLQVADYRIWKCGNGIGNSRIYWIVTMNIGNGFGLCNTQSQRNRIGNVEWGKGNIMKMNVDTIDRKSVV